MSRRDEPENQTHTFLRSLGQGLLGPAWQARRTADGLLVRYKELRQYRHQAGPRLDALRRLATALQGIPSPSLCRIVDCGLTASGVVFVETIFVEGRPLPDWVTDATQAQALMVLRQVASLLAQLHAQGLSHGALRPSQLIVTAGSDGKPLCIVQDIGLAARVQPPLSLTELAPEARAFFAPEQERSGALVATGPEADVYALGQILMWMLARLADVSTLGLSGPTTRWTALVQRMLAAQPGQRPTMAEVARELAGLEASAAPEPSPPPPRRADRVDVTAASPPAGSRRRGGSVAPAQRIGQTLDDYLLTRLLGEGGMGAVFEAVHQQIGRRVAIKILRPELATDRSVRERFRGEAQVANRVEHANVVEITDLREAADGTLYLVMELLAGQVLRQRIEQSPQGLGPVTALHIAHQCALALAAAHEKGIVHRDFKPENVMVLAGAADEAVGARGLGGPRPAVKVLDFGIAKILLDPDKQDLTNPALSAFLGTLEYAAPEQFGDPRTADSDGARPRAIGPAVDVFALAVVLCELWSGRRPFSGFSMILFMDEPPAPSLPSGMSPSLQALVLRMLQRAATERPTMAEVATALRRELQALEPTRALPAGTTRPGPRLLLPILFSLIAVSLLSVLAVLLWPRRDPSERARLYVPEATALLRAGLQGSTATVRRAAVLGIGASGRSDLAELLLPILPTADRPTVALIAQALQRLPVAAAADGLRLASQHRPLDLAAVEAAAALARLHESAADSGSGTLPAMLREGSGKTQARAALRLCERHDAAGCDALRALLQGSAKELDRWESLFILASQDDAEAQAQLVRELEQSSDRHRQLVLSGYLARLRGPKSAAAERTLAEAAQAKDFDAALLAAHARNPAGREILLAVLADPKRPPELRMSAAEALGEAGDLVGALEGLGTLLRQSTQPLEVRLAAASALLRLAGPSVGAEGDSSLQKLCALYPRLLACLLADSDAAPSEEALTATYASLRPPERALMARLLADKRGAGAAAVLLRALDDPDYVVRGQALRSLKRVLAALRGTARGSVEQAMQSLRQRLLASSSPYDQVIALSLQDADASAHDRLLTMLRSASLPKDLRGLIVELAERRADNPLLAAGLADSDREVRFAAARHLAELGSRRGAEVLREVLLLGDGWSLLAYALLHRLGLAPSSGAGVDWERILRGEGRLWARFEAVASLTALPPERAIPLLQGVLTDPAAVVRQQAAASAATLLRQGPRPRLRSQLVSLLRSLSTDPELYVRTRALQLLAELDPHAARPPEPAAAATGRAAAGPAPAATDASDHRDAASAAPATPPSAADATARPPESREGLAPGTARRPTGPSPQAQKATQALEQAQRMLTAQPIRAMNAFTELRRSPHLTDKQRDVIDGLVRQLRADLASYRIKQRVDGVCKLDKDPNWQKPGKHMIQPEKSPYKLYKTLEAGKDYICDFCVPADQQECR